MLHRLGVTVLSQTPAEYAAIVEDLGPARLYVPTLRRVLSSGASLDRELIESFRAASDLTIHDGFRQAESLVLVANTAADEDKDGSIGLPLPGSQVGVIDEEAVRVRARSRGRSRGSRQAAVSLP